MPELKHLSPEEAFKLLQSNPDAVLIDVRSSMEFLFVGHPVGAIHIAWIDEPDWEVNPDFADEVLHLLEHQGVTTPHEAPVVLICRSGNRTLDAGQALLDAGFRNVIHITTGFEGERDEDMHRGTLNGWRHDGFPWEQC
jgi:rhodanese-related sulfurtransferase